MRPDQLAHLQKQAVSTAMRAMQEDGVIPLPIVLRHCEDIGTMLQQVPSENRKNICAMLRRKADALRTNVLTVGEARMLDAIVNAWDPWGSGKQP